VTVPADRRLLRWTTIALGIALAGAAVWSNATGGFVATMLSAEWSDATSIESIRAYLNGWGPLAPVVYVFVVTLEVVIAPLPGTILYAPAGAVFGAGYGGTLSLIGNTIGATVACALAHAFGSRISSKLDGSALAPLMDRLRPKGLWLVALLRVNPLTSSDLVSYAAGFVRVPIWHVTLGTTIGMAPICYAQSYAAAQFFTLLPGAGPLLVVIGVAYMVAVVVVLARTLRPTGHEKPGADGEADGPGDRR